MEIQEHLLKIEEQFWTGDAEFYRRHLTEDSLMVFAEPVGVLDKAQTVEAIASGPRWTAVAFEDVRLLRLAEDAIIVTYRARADREGEESSYTTRASSAYVQRDGAWKLTLHQQTAD